MGERCATHLGGKRDGSACQRPTSGGRVHHHAAGAQSNGEQRVLIILTVLGALEWFGHPRVFVMLAREGLFRGHAVEKIHPNPLAAHLDLVRSCSINSGLRLVLLHVPDLPKCCQPTNACVTCCSCPSPLALQLEGFCRNLLQCTPRAVQWWEAHPSAGGSSGCGGGGASRNGAHTAHSTGSTSSVLSRLSLWPTYLLVSEQYSQEGSSVHKASLYRCAPCASTFCSCWCPFAPRQSACFIPPHQHPRLGWHWVMTIYG